ncbi:MAG TPA: hypothetical protein VJN92_10700 [Candidatus Acidoferrum sp.]|nr:hypothetical protein [Candidatus Acidoferrum sp.]
MRNRPWRREPELRVELLFDGFATPTLGARSTTHPQRHLLYRAEPFELDLLIELRSDSNRLRITGQLLDTSLPAVFRRGVRVTLWNFRQSFVTLRTNEWGEFLGEIEDSGEMMVALKIQLREIVISIRNVLDWPALHS